MLKNNVFNTKLNQNWLIIEIAWWVWSSMIQFTQKNMVSSLLEEYFWRSCEYPFFAYNYLISSKEKYIVSIQNSSYQPLKSNLIGKLIGRIVVLNLKIRLISPGSHLVLIGVTQRINNKGNIFRIHTHGNKQNEHISAGKWIQHSHNERIFKVRHLRSR